MMMNMVMIMWIMAMQITMTNDDEDAIVNDCFAGAIISTCTSISILTMIKSIINIIIRNSKNNNGLHMSAVVVVVVLIVMVVVATT